MRGKFSEEDEEGRGVGCAVDEGVGCAVDEGVGCAVDEGTEYVPICGVDGLDVPMDGDGVSEIGEDLMVWK